MDGTLDRVLLASIRLVRLLLEEAAISAKVCCPTAHRGVGLWGYKKEKVIYDFLLDLTPQSLKYVYMYALLLFN